MAAILTPTPITDLNRIDLVGSPRHLNITNAAPFKTARVSLWIWSGDLAAIPINPVQVLEKSKVSVLDSRIVIEVGDFISQYIRPSIFASGNVAISNEGVFWQYEIETFDNFGIAVGTTQTFPTRYATLGWNWNYEGQALTSYNRGAFGFESFDVPKYYSPYITYYDRRFNLSGATKTSKMISVSVVSPASQFVRCAVEQYLIIYINKYGLWDTFTPSGKVVASNEIKRDTYNRAFRNPLGINPQTDHQKVNFNINSRQKYLINTGSLKEGMGELVEEILYSPLVYLVQFQGALEPVGAPITVDTTLYSVDTTLITADNSGQQFGGYATFRQIPVTVEDTDFTRKSRINDKNKISYNIRFEESFDKILNIR